MWGCHYFTLIIRLKLESLLHRYIGILPLILDSDRFALFSFLIFVDQMRLCLALTYIGVCKYDRYSILGFELLAKSSKPNSISNYFGPLQVEEELKMVFG